MTQIYTILFDLDGTIVNTAPDLMAAHNHVMKKFGHAEKKMSDIKCLGNKMYKSINGLFFLKKPYFKSYWLNVICIFRL